MNVHSLRQLIPSSLQHRRPKERMEIRDVLANEMMNLAVGISPPVVEILPVGVAPFLRTRDITDWRVEPNVEVVSG